MISPPLLSILRRTSLLVDRALVQRRRRQRMARRAQLRQRHALLLSDKGGQRDATGILAGQKIHRGSLGPGMDTRARRANRANSVNSDERANIKTSYKSPLAGIKETCCYYNPRAGPGVDPSLMWRRLGFGSPARDRPRRAGYRRRRRSVPGCCSGLCTLRLRTSHLTATPWQPLVVSCRTENEKPALNLLLPLTARQ